MNTNNFLNTGSAGWLEWIKELCNRSTLHMQHSAQGAAPLRQYSEEPVSIYSQDVFSHCHISGKKNL